MDAIPKESEFNSLLLMGNEEILSYLKLQDNLCWWLVSTDNGYNKYKQLVEEVIKEIHTKNSNPNATVTTQIKNNQPNQS